MDIDREKSTHQRLYRKIMFGYRVSVRVTLFALCSRIDAHIEVTARK